MRGDHVPSGDRREITRSSNFEARKPAVCHVVDLLRSHPRPWMEDHSTCVALSLVNNDSDSDNVRAWNS